MSNYALRIPNSLFEYAKRLADEESVSMNQFFVMAIAEKVSALKTEAFFREQAERGDVERAKRVLGKVRKGAVVLGDELPAAISAQEPVPAAYGVRKAKGRKRSRKS